MLGQQVALARFQRAYGALAAESAGRQAQGIQPMGGVVLCLRGGIETTGFRFEADGKSIAYATDFSEITTEMVTLFNGVDVLVSDCLRREPHPTHAHLGMALELAERCGAGHTVLTHLDKSMDYATLAREVPENVSVGFDGMELVL